MQTDRRKEGVWEFDRNVRAKRINKRKQEDCDEKQSGKSEQEWQMEA